MTQIYDLSDPAHPLFIRNFGLVGQQPGATRAGADRAARADLDRAEGQPRLLRLRHQRGRRAADRRPRQAARTARRSRRRRTCSIRRSRGSTCRRCIGAHTVFPLLGVDVAEFATTCSGSAARLRRHHRRVDPERVPRGAPDDVDRRHHAPSRSRSASPTGRCPRRAATSARAAGASARIRRTRT